jgi:hypothetical protein
VLSDLQVHQAFGISNERTSLKLKEGLLSTLDTIHIRPNTPIRLCDSRLDPLLREQDSYAAIDGCGGGEAIGRRSGKIMTLSKQRSLLLGIGVVLSLSACNLSTPFGKKPVVDYKQNPTPQQRYDITLTIADAPGTFASMEGLVQYDVVNEECLPPPGGNPGGYSSPIPTEDVPFALTQVSENEYKGTIYADMMLNEDYYGRGLCQWRLIQARVRMKATGAEGETLFIPGLSAAPLFAEKTKITYFWKDRFPRSETDNYPDFGRNDRSEFKSELQQQLFSITITSRKGTP